MAVKGGAAAPARESAGKTHRRQQAVKDHKRQIILDAAQRIFAAEGLEGASLRAIAKEAGYTPGALYFHYANKEEIYGDLLAASLDRLHEAVRRPMLDAAADAGERMRAGALGFYGYYEACPRDLDLGFYLFKGMRPLGLTPELDATLNAKLRAALCEIEGAMRDTGASPETARRETAALFAHAAGLLLLVHTGRIRMFRVDGRALFLDYLEALTKRLAA
jgi:AcrR family transcriptional regulator